MRVTHVGAELHRTSAEHERRRCGAAVGDPAGGDAGTRTASTTCGKSENSPGCMLMLTPVKVAR